MQQRAHRLDVGIGLQLVREICVAVRLVLVCEIEQLRRCHVVFLLQEREMRAEIDSPILQAKLTLIERCVPQDLAVQPRCRPERRR